MSRACVLVASVLVTTACSAGTDKSGSPGSVLDSARPEDDGSIVVDDTGGLDDGGTGFDVGPGPDVGPPVDGDVPSGPPADCKGLQCQQKKCAPGKTTSVSGTVFAPNGTLPLYNVIVYVPNAALAPFPPGLLCDKCGTVASGEPVVTALSDSKGQFRLLNVPVGKDIPLVVQLGKWRRKVVIPEVKECVDNPLTDKNLTRLPKNQTEGDLPRIAVTTGGCDQLSCMLPKVGIDASEFGTKGSSKAVHFYSAGGASGPTGMTDAKAFWSNLDELKKYDVAVFSCECEEAPATKDATSYKAVTDYLAAGGRIFTTDFQYTWYKYSPDPALKAAATITGGAPPGGNPVTLDTSFPKGKALADWLKFVDPASAYGSVPCDFVFDNYAALDKAKTQTWGSSFAFFIPGGSAHPRFMTTNTPVGKPAESQCGKAVHLDAHINQTDKVDATYPAGCASKIKTGEEAFAFFFFDLSSCIQKEDAPPAPPPPIK